VRYNHVVSILKTGFNLNDSEYNKYFGELKWKIDGYRKKIILFFYF